MTSRRNFIGVLGAGAALPALRTPFPRPALPMPVSAEWDMSWVDQLDKPNRVVFDSPEISEGGALWRSVMLQEQYREVYGTFADQFASVLVLRHKGVALAMDHGHWERFNIGEQAEMKDRDGKWITRNPIGPPDPGAAASAARYTLTGFIANGGIVLACNLAFNFAVVPKYRGDGIAREAARAEALTHLVPGVILQPSGFFAVVRAQQAGCALFCNG